MYALACHTRHDKSLSSRPCERRMCYTLSSFPLSVSWSRTPVEWLIFDQLRLQSKAIRHLPDGMHGLCVIRLNPAIRPAIDHPQPIIEILHLLLAGIHRVANSSRGESPRISR